MAVNPVPQLVCKMPLLKKKVLGVGTCKMESFSLLEHFPHKKRRPGLKSSSAMVEYFCVCQKDEQQKNA